VTGDKGRGTWDVGRGTWDVGRQSLRTPGFDFRFPFRIFAAFALNAFGLSVPVCTYGR
jgi:hypothetical protein